jgi:hypothetical protein
VLPQFFIFGTHDLVNRTGPAIWQRCIRAENIPEAVISAGTVFSLSLRASSPQSRSDGPLLF